MAPWTGRGRGPAARRGVDHGAARRDAGTAAASPPWRNGAPPEMRPRFTPGEVMHAFEAIGHRFTYRVFSLLIDLDRLDEAGRLSRLFSVNRANLVSFHEAHTERADETLRAMADRLLVGAGLRESPRVSCCSPTRGSSATCSIRYRSFRLRCRKQAAGDDLFGAQHVGEQHIYVAPVRDGERNDAGIRQERRKTCRRSSA